MDFRQTLAAKCISFVLVNCFLWTFVSGYDITFAAVHGKLSLKDNQNNAGKKDRVEKKFEKAIEDIDDILETTRKKKTRKERKAGKVKLRAKIKEIEDHDRELRKRFKETEERIRDLPDEIKKRHKDFVTKYEENLKTLKARLDAVERAETDKDEEREIKEAREYLKKAKPKKKHIPLDPNKLPHRTPEDKKIKLEKKKPDTRRNMPKLRKKRAGLLDDDINLENNILVAANGSLDGLLSKPVPEIQDHTPILLAQTSTSTRPRNAPPTEADLAETIDVQLTDAIKTKAAELNHHPVKIYEWVRNNVEFVPTYGSIQGADYCLQTLQCNSFDTSSLLIALYRTSGIHARYVYGTREIPIDRYMNWVGNFTDQNAALSFAASGGIPIGGLTEGGKIVSAQLEHVWVEAYIDYIPSRGARHRTGQGDTWIELDPSFKQYTYTEGIDIKEAVPFDAQTFIDQIQSTATINEEEGYVTGVDSLYIQQTMDDYKTQVENYVNQSHPDATVEDVLGTKEILKENYPFLLGTLKYRTTSIEQRYSEIPDALRHKISFSVTLDSLLHDANPLTITKTLPELAGKKITLSYSPATQADEDVINSYLPKPHDDGTPIDPSELPSSLPAYLINLKPELRIDGEVAATGGPVMMGLTETFNMTFTHPKLSTDVVSNTIEAGEYLGICINLNKISKINIHSILNKIQTIQDKLGNNDVTGLSKEDILGELLSTVALYYYVELDLKKYVYSNNMHVNFIRLPSEAIFSLELDISLAFNDLPLSATVSGLAMDVDLDMQVVKAHDGNNITKKNFMKASGLNSSSLEHIVPEMLFSSTDYPFEGISAVKAFRIANEQNIPIYTITSANITSLLPVLQVDPDVKSSIRNAINMGKEVTVSKTNINFNNWNGCGYIIMDPDTGTGAYMISGGLSGAVIMVLNPAFAPIYLSNALLYDIAEGYFRGLDRNLLSQAELEIAKNYGPSPENCAHYDVAAIYIICMEAGDNVWANIARYGLKKDFLEQGYSLEWLGHDHTKWFTYATLIYFESPQ